jgi:hypothetical protein
MALREDLNYLFEFCDTPRQKEMLAAYIETGSSIKAADKLGGTNDGAIRRTIGRLRTRAAGKTLSKQGVPELNQLRADQKRNMAEIEALRKELSFFTAMTDFTRHYQPVKICPKGAKRGSATAVLNASDWHFEEEVKASAVNGVNEFNLDIAKMRAVEFFRSGAGLIDMCRSRSNISTVVLNLLGDFITGWIHEELQATNQLTPPAAVLAVFESLSSGIDFLLKEVKPKELIIPCAAGNHGRFTKRRYTKLNVETNYDWLIYQLLARWFDAKNEKRIRFLFPQGDLIYYTVYDKVIRAMHGDSVQYGGGIGGVHIPLRKHLDRQNTTIRADWNYLGHFHQDIRGEDYRINGSLIGYNEYAVRKGLRFAPPSQSFELIHPKYGSTAPFPIILPTR